MIWENLGGRVELIRFLVRCGLFQIIISVSAMYILACSPRQAGTDLWNEVSVFLNYRKSYHNNKLYLEL